MAEAVHRLALLAMFRQPLPIPSVIMYGYAGNPSLKHYMQGDNLERPLCMQGEFKLNKLAVGKGAVMCSHSRLLSGSVMEQNSVLLEHTLVVCTYAEQLIFHIWHYMADEFLVL